MEVKEWVEELCAKKNVQGKFEQLNRLIDNAVQAHPDKHHMEGHIFAYLVLAIEILGYLPQERQLFVMTKLVPWTYFYQEIQKDEHLNKNAFRPR